MSLTQTIGTSKKIEKNFERLKTARPVLLLTINNGAAHTKAAETIADAWRKVDSQTPAQVIEMSDFMSPLARFTHVSAYLWLVKNAPGVWGKIDAYQKRQPQTSPEWFYRRECRKLFDFVEKTNPSAIVSTEVGCAEIAALIKRDLKLQIPLVAVNLDYEADRAWVQPETDLYCLATDLIKKDFLNLGVEPKKLKTWGAPLDERFRRLTEEARRINRQEICEWLKLNSNLPIVLVSGGGEGLGKIESIIKKISNLPTQIIVLTGRNEKLKMRCEKLSAHGQVKILGWTDRVAQLMQAADFSISKLGLTFYEAMSCGLPIIALPPPPGAERIQYEALEKFETGRAAKSLDELAEAVSELLASEQVLSEMREKTNVFGNTNAAENLALWLQENLG